MKVYSLKSLARATSTTAARLSSSETVGRNVQNALIHNPTGGQTVYIGGSDVSSANGFPLVAGATISVGDIFLAGARGEIDLYHVWVVAASATPELRVLYSAIVTV